MATRQIPEYDILVESLNTMIQHFDKNNVELVIEQINHIVPYLANSFMNDLFIHQLITFRSKCTDSIQKAYIIAAILRHPIGYTCLNNHIID